MGDHSKIQWTQASWNPLVGCTKVSEGCRHCYAMVMASRIANAAQAALRDGKTLTDVQAAYRKVVRWTRGGKEAADIYDVALPQWNGRVEMIDSLLTLPLRWKRPRRVFVNSMSDLFHESVPFEFIDRVFAVMALCPQHTFQVLTKRPERMAEYFADRHLRGIAFSPEVEAILDKMFPKGLSDEVYDGRTDSGKRYELPGWWIALDKVKGFGLSAPPNVWLGTSCEDQETADKRIPHLLRCPAAVRFLSCEPLIGEIDLRNLRWDGDGIGGEANPAVLDAFSGLVAHPLTCKEDWPPRRVNRSWMDDEPDPWSGIHWVIVGGESGHGARPCVIGHIRRIVKDCLAADVPVFVKQLGTKPTNREGEPHTITDHHDIEQFPEDLRVRQYPEVGA